MEKPFNQFVHLNRGGFGVHGNACLTGLVVF